MDAQRRRLERAGQPNIYFVEVLEATPLLRFWISRRESHHDRVASGIFLPGPSHGIADELWLCYAREGEPAVTSSARLTHLGGFTGFYTASSVAACLFFPSPTRVGYLFNLKLRKTCLRRSAGSITSRCFCRPITRVDYDFFFQRFNPLAQF